MGKHRDPMYDFEPHHMFRHLWEPVGTQQQEINNAVMNMIVNSEETGPGGFFPINTDWRTIPRGMGPDDSSSGQMPEIFVGVPWKYRIVAYTLLVPLGYYVLECMYFYSGLNALGAIGCLSAILGVCAIGIHRAKVAGDRDVAEMNAKYAAARDAQIQRTLERHKAAREAAVAKASIEGEQKDPYDEYDEWLEKKGYCKRWWEGEK